MNGHTMAGGYIFALCHDYRIMKAGGKITLSEINVGLPVTGSYSSLVSELLPP
jgi:enoyl-CoA hydratase/carnithine racemase